jgi:hypothetical protein
MSDTKSYVIEVVRHDGFTGYVYETSNYGNKYLDAPISLPKAKKWKSFEGAQKNKDKFLKAQPDAIKLFQMISVREISEQDVDKSNIQIQEQRLQRELESLQRNYFTDSKVEKPIKRKSAEILVSFQAGDILRYYPEANDMNKFELTQVEQVFGATLSVKGHDFRRIDGFPIDSSKTSGRVLPNDDTLSNYLVALHIIQSVAWSDMPVEQVIQVASIIQTQDCVSRQPTPLI